MDNTAIVGELYYERYRDVLRLLYGPMPDTEYPTHEQLLEDVEALMPHAIIVGSPLIMSNRE